MEHIKKPIRVKKSVWAGDIEDAHGILLCGMSESAPFPMAYEMVNAVNQHDDLVAQRDALVAACESVLESMDIAAEGFGDSIANGMFRGAFLGVRKQIVAALALVKGEQKSDDATA